MKNTVTEWLPNILIMSCCILIATSSTALASGGSWEWESNMDSIVQSFSGPMARLISVLAIIGLAALLMVIWIYAAPHYSNRYRPDHSAQRFYSSK